MGIPDRSVALIMDITAAAGDRIQLFIDRYVDITATARIRMTVIDRKIITMKIAATAHMNLQMSCGATDKRIGATGLTNGQGADFQSPMQVAAAG